MMQDFDKHSKKRVVYHLEDGRKKYSTNSHGEIELWNEIEIALLRIDSKSVEPFGFSNDLTVFCSSYSELKKLLPKERVVKVIGFETEDAESPLSKNVIIISDAYN